MTRLRNIKPENTGNTLCSEKILLYRNHLETSTKQTKALPAAELVSIDEGVESESNMTAAEVVS